MVEKKPKTFIRDLLTIEALKNSDIEDPKSSNQIMDEVEKNWRKIFPNEPLEKNFKGTISRHVTDMNLSGLYNIKIHPNNKRGYYNARPLLTTAEVTAIGAAIYQMNLTVADKKILFKKIKAVTDTNGNSMICSFERQMNFESPNEKNSKQSLGKLQIICKAVVESRKISFLMQRNRIVDDLQKIIAAPYLIFLKGKDLFLTAKVEGDSAPADFKISLMSKVEILEENFQSERKFLLSQHLNKICPKPIKLNINFPESFIENVYNQFEHNKIRSFAPNGKIFDGEWQFHATISVTEDENLYRWLRQHCDKIKIISPDNVKTKLKEQLLKALSTL